MKDYTVVFERAREEEIGLVLKTNNTKGLQIELDHWAKANGYNDLMACIPSIPDVVFLVKKSVELPE